jgi:hypothetical protein
VRNSDKDAAGACPEDNSKKPRKWPGAADGHQAGLIEIEPTSELALIAYGERADRRTVIVDIPTKVRVLIL